MNLSNIFTAVAHKELARVDLPGGGSNQHEINGSTALKRFFGASDTEGEIGWVYFSDDHETVRDAGRFRFYDARARSADRTGRSEWRFYYQGDFLKIADVGDLLILARSAEGVFGLVFQRDSGWVRCAKVLFGIIQSGSELELISDATLTTQELELVRQRILEELGIEVALPSVKSDQDLVVERFGNVFPSTKEMSAFARGLAEVDPTDADETLSRWLEREALLFRALETVVVQIRLNKGFQTVDDFIAFSLSVHQRRKSRMGWSLENHLAALFDVHKLRYEPHARTEAKNEPDFLFPGSVEYHQPSFDASLLVMLGAKSTCKDRWRQVLTEAARIPHKHLCTLEPGISTAQTDEMRQSGVMLVVPRRLMPTYTSNQAKEMLTVAQFVKIVRGKQQTL
jgi:hypothetical protein